MTHRLYDTGEAAIELGIPERVISDLKTHGKVVPDDVIRGRGRGGLVPLWSLETLRPHAEAYLARRSRHASEEAP